METYLIHGTEVEYDTFDLANMELFDGELRRVQQLAQSHLTTGFDEDTYLAAMREVCEGIRDAFDTLLGEGTAERIFGSRLNVRDLSTAWNRFVADASELQAGLGVSVGASAPPANREQRRAAEREQRRQEARQRAALKHASESV